MAYRENAKILKADCLADGVYEIWFETKDIAKAAKAGQFISVYSNDGSRMLPRPISICKVENNNLRIVFRVAGKGTEEFSKMKAGEYLDIQCYVSLEEKMACGIGACLACVCKSTEIDDHSQVKNKRVCKEGPVFNVKEVEL